MRWRCRCNKRSCQARKTLAKHPDDYERGRPKCHIVGCEGIMYALKNQSITERNGVTCYEDCFPEGHPHNMANKRCKNHEEYVLSKALNSKAGVAIDEPDW